MPRRSDNIALFDLDGTLCDYEGQLRKDLNEMKSPGEPDFWSNGSSWPAYIQNRAHAIKSSQAWWENLPRFHLGWDVLKAARSLDYRIMILTQGPRNLPVAWAGKKIWIDKNLWSDVDITITRDKGLVYGKVLVDDYPGYIERWLRWRKNGLVIMPANDLNKDFEHPQVIRYDGSNLREVRGAMKKRLGLASEPSLLRSDPRLKTRLPN